MCLSRYQEWMQQQSLEFISEVHPGCTIPRKFKPQRSGITLKELEELDNRFINNPEGDNDGSTND